MDTLTAVHVCLAGFFACAAIFSALYWWSSRSERVLLVFSVQCVVYTVFCVALVSFFRAKTVPDSQAALGRFVTLGVIVHILALQFYADLGDRRDGAYRALVAGALGLLALLNQWVPLRGTVVELQAIRLPGGDTALVAIRTPPGAALALLYLAVLWVYGYGFFVTRAIWRRDRAGAVLVAVGSTAVLAGAALAFLVDFAKLRAPYAGAWPHVVFVLSTALFLAREYSARGLRVVATERRFETAFEHAPIGKALLAPDGRFIRVNRALCRMLDFTGDELCARRLADVTHQDGGSDEAEFRRLLEAPAHNIEKRLFRKDGEPVWALLAISIVPDDNREPAPILVQVQDMTELRAHRERLEELVATRTGELAEAKNEAERANKAKSQFLAHMSHEIRNPLHVLLLCAENLERDLTLHHEQQKQIGIIHRNGQHLLGLINDVLDMSKIEAGRLELVEDRFDPRATLDEVERMFAAKADSKGIELKIECAPELPHALLGDGAKVRQILINLASNALKFTTRGSICFKASSSGLADGGILVTIVVADTGVGIAMQDVARMFQPFEQLDAGKRAGGTGLGLAISLAYARLMGGDLTVEGAANVGSTFTFTFVTKRVGPGTLRGARDVTARLEPGAT